MGCVTTLQRLSPGFSDLSAGTRVCDTARFAVITVLQRPRYRGLKGATSGVSFRSKGRELTHHCSLE